MAGQRFRKDMHILFNGREYLIDRRLRNGELRIKDTATNEYRPVPELELVEALFDGNLEFLAEGTDYSFAQARSAQSYVADLSVLDETDPKQKKRKEEARRKYRYVNEVLTKSLSKLTQETLEPLIAQVALLISDSNPPCWSTLYNWVRAYVEAGEDIRVLIPATNMRGNRKPRYSGTRLKKYTEKDKEKAKEVAKVIELVVGEKFLSLQRNSILETHRFLEGRIKEINKFRKEEDKLPTPQPDGLYYYISKLDSYEVDVARFGRRYADRKHKQFGKSPRPTRPLERVAMDHTKTDLMAVDLEMRLPIGRATLTDALDLYSHMVLGSYLSFEPASYLSVMQCLLNAIKPKTYVKKLYPEVEHHWECYGIPETIVVDNGREFHSVDFEDACLQLGIITEYAPPGNPEYKGSKERYYETLNNQLLHSMPGTTFSNILDRADYDPLKNAIIDVEDLKKIHHIYVIDIYARQTHKGIRDVPARLWNEAIADFPPALPLKGTDLRILIGYIEHRTIRSQGVELFGLFYNCDDLSLLRRELKGYKVKIKYDPTDISVIYVADQKNGLFIPVPAVDQEYTRGLTKYQHDVIRNYARKIAESYVDSDALWRARKKIEEIVERAWERSRKSSTRMKLARFKGIGLQNS
jgi:putative transposase